MPQWLKVLLLLLVAAVLGLGLLVGGCIWWVSANKGRLVEGGRAAQTEGKAFGATHAQGQCIEDGLTRLKSCGPVDFVCEALTKLRVDSCMAVAEDDGACAKVPGRGDILKEALWGNEECTRRGYAGSQSCGRLLQGVAETCAKRERLP